MKVLGIETSCDETAVCLIEAEGDFGPTFSWKMLGNALLSQAKLHEQYGGVFPNLAKREHAKNLVPLLSQCLPKLPLSHVGFTKPNIENLRKILEREPELLDQLIPLLEQHGRPDVDVITVTYGPGLEPALWVGINFAKALSLVWNIPIVAVNHMEGHVIMSMMGHSHILENVGMSGKLNVFEFPVLALLISGGHTELVLSKTFGEYRLIGQTRDDAAGEAFDKVARLLGLGYPGGPEISRLAAEARNDNLVADFKLPRPMLSDDNFDFSFSGLKTAVLRLVDGNQLLEDDKRKIAREFEDAVAEVLVAKTLRAVEAYGANTVVVGGGVSANKHIRSELAAKLETIGAKLLVCPPELSTDNAIMIALAGYFHTLNKDFADPATLRATGNLKLA